MEDLITTILAGNIGTVTIVLILWKSGLLKYLLTNGKRDFSDGKPLTTLKEVAENVAKLEMHFNNDTTILLQNIKEQLQINGRKLDEIGQGIAHIKAKLNGK